MPETLQNLLQLLQSRIRLVAFLVALGLLTAVYVTKRVETGDIGVRIPPTPTPAKLDTKREMPASIQQEIAENKISIENNEQFRGLISDSMFSVKAVRGAIAQEAKANELYAEAERLFLARQYAESMRKCKEVLKLRPFHIRALKLKKELEKKLDTTPASSGPAPTGG